MKHWRTTVWSLALVVCGVSVCGFSLVSCSTAATQAVPPTAATRQVTFAGAVPAWADTATTIMGELEQWRGHRFLDDLQVTFQSPSDPDYDPDLQGWYNSATKALVVTTGSSDQMGRGVLLHEIYHALQDQHFDLYQLHVESQDAPDFDRAVTAIIEGDAMLAVSELMNYNFLDHAQLPAAGPVPADFFEKVFLYGAGLKFIEAVRQAGGWAAVDAVFQDPPQATALIFQPERYLAGERTTPMIAVPVEAGETLQTQMIRGEYELRFLLAQVPELRAELDQIGPVYVTDTLGLLTASDETPVHRWLIELSSAEAASNWLDRFRTAMATATAYDSQITATPTVTLDGATLVVEW